jgi:2-phospho-L-lactate guanylyltransferase
VRIVALIPVKSLEHGKSRLAQSLDLSHRIQLTEETLRRLMHVLHAEPRVERIVVVTRDANVIEWLHGRSVEVVEEHGHGLNAALTEARTAIGRCKALLVLPADVAAISSHDIAALIDIADAAPKPCIVLTPDRHSHGTNALLLHPPDAIEFAFGADSLRMHTLAAENAAVHVQLYRSESLGLDLDLPEDYELYSRQW